MLNNLVISYLQKHENTRRSHKASDLIWDSNCTWASARNFLNHLGFYHRICGPEFCIKVPDGLCINISIYFFNDPSLPLHCSILFPKFIICPLTSNVEVQNKCLIFHPFQLQLQYKQGQFFAFLPINSIMKLPSTLLEWDRKQSATKNISADGFSGGQQNSVIPHREIQ